MAQDIDLLGAIYLSVPAVILPKDGGGTATFTDVTDSTVTASDVASGKYFYTSAGVKTQGTVTVYNGEHHTPTTTDHSVTISLTNPRNTGSFSKVEIREWDGVDIYDAGNLLFTMTSPTQSTTIALSSAKYGFAIYAYGGSPHIYTGSSYITCTGDVTYEDTNGSEIVGFSVTGDGTVTISGINYDW